MPRAAFATSQAAREARAPDAKRLCAAVIHDTTKRQACMRAHAAQLSKACLDALHGVRAKAAPTDKTE